MVKNHLQQKYGVDSSSKPKKAPAPKKKIKQSDIDSQRNPDPNSNPDVKPSNKESEKSTPTVKSNKTILKIDTLSSGIETMKKNKKTSQSTRNKSTAVKDINEVVPQGNALLSESEEEHDVEEHERKVKQILDQNPNCELNLSDDSDEENSNNIPVKQPFTLSRTPSWINEGKSSKSKISSNKKANKSSSGISKKSKVQKPTESDESSMSSRSSRSTTPEVTQPSRSISKTRSSNRRNKKVNYVEDKGSDDDISVNSSDFEDKPFEIDNDKVKINHSVDLSEESDDFE